MRIFLTGATGYVGSAVLHALLRTGHHVTALFRDPREAERRAVLGVQPVVGDLSDPQTYAQAVEASDGVIHAALAPAARGPDIDRRAIDAFLDAANRRAAAGLHSTLIYTSDIRVLGSTNGQATEDAPVRPTALAAWRPEHEQRVLDAGKGQWLRAVVVRPGVVYGGGRGIITDLLKTAANGLVRVVGDGQNRWACVYDRDLAELYVKVVTAADASGVYHANDEADERVVDIVEAVARGARVLPEVRYVPIDEARAKLGPLADALALNQIVRSPRARALGWAPTLRSVAGNVARLLEELRSKREAA
jgi:nucleoside-diphosphate-sugar epimerase